MRANLFLFSTALIWGFGFIAQASAGKYIPPLTFSGLRFLIGGLCLLPIALILNQNDKKKFKEEQKNTKKYKKQMFWGSLIAGILLFGGAFLQQAGLMQSTAAKTGLITGLYVIFVPFGAYFMGYKLNAGTIIGALAALFGLYLLSTTEKFSLSVGDSLVLAGVVFWTLHVLFLSYLAPKVNPCLLASLQAIFCGIIGLSVAFFFEPWLDLNSLIFSIKPFLWASIMSVTCGYTFQVIGQREAKPSIAAIILQLEAVVAAICGWLFLNEIMTKQMILGAFIMLTGMLICQLWPQTSIIKTKNTV